MSRRRAISDDQETSPNRLYKKQLLKYDLITEKMEENEKKRKDPNRTFVMTEGLVFLSSIKFFNP